MEAILRAGADFVLSYASLGVQTIFSIVQGRELVMLGEGVDLFQIALPPALAGRTLAELNVGAHTGLNVIAVQEDSRIITNPPPSRPLQPGSTLLALGSPEQRRAFAERFQ